MEPDIAKSGPATRRRLLFSLAWVALGITYAILVAVATATHHARPAAWLLLVMLTLGLVQALFVGQRGSALFALFNLIVVVTVFTLNGPFAAIGLTTAIVQACISALFFRGLSAGRTDIVTRMACAIRPGRSARELAYTRRVAQCWAWLMAAMSVGSLIVSFVPTGALWWWWMNVVCYIVPIGFFINEWLVRHWWLREDLRASEPIDWGRVRHLDYASLFRP
ncbi:MAG: hypothetical protein ACRETC_02015 [Gammaproteobacteria bacterium]